MRHHTRDSGKRAADIADREAEEFYQGGGDYYKKWLEVYDEALRELAENSGSRVENNTALFVGKEPSNCKRERIFA